MELPELGIKNSKLADKVAQVLVIRSRKEMAHKLVEIADTSIKCQMHRDVIDLAIDKVFGNKHSLDEILDMHMRTRPSSRDEHAASLRKSDNNERV